MNANPCQKYVFNDGPIGLVLAGGNDLDSEQPFVFVEYINESSQASSMAGLEIGDIIQFVNEHSVIGKEFVEVMNSIRAALRPVSLSFRKMQKRNPSPNAPISSHVENSFVINPDIFRAEAETRKSVSKNIDKMHLLNAKRKMYEEMRISRFSKKPQHSIEQVQQEGGKRRDKSDKNTIEKILQCEQQILSLPFEYFDDSSQVTLTAYAKQHLNATMKSSLNMRRRKSFVHRRKILADFGTKQTSPGEHLKLHRVQQTYISYVPSHKLRRRLKNFEDWKAEEKVVRLADIPLRNKTGVLALYLNLRNETSPPLPCKYFNDVLRMKNLEVLIIQGANLDSLKSVEFPRLLYCDISKNKIANLFEINDLVEHSTCLQYLDLRENPVLLTWSSSGLPQINMKSPHRHGNAPAAIYSSDWELVVKLPDLVVLNGQVIRYTHRLNATSIYGGIVENRRLSLRHWDAVLCESIPELRSMSVLSYVHVRVLALSGLNLRSFHVGAFHSLESLDLSKNIISTVCFSGLEQAKRLWALNLEGNQLSDENEFSVFGGIPSLQTLFLSFNPFHDPRIPSKFRYRILHACRECKGTQSRHSGLMYLDGHQSTIEEKVQAMVFVTKNGNTFDKLTDTRDPSRTYCCLKTRKRFKGIDNESMTHAHIFPSDIYRFELLMEEMLGSTGLELSKELKNIRHLTLQRKGIKAIDLGLFQESLISLDLSDNFLTDVGKLEKLTKLRHLNLSGNAICLADNIDAKIQCLTALRSLSLLSAKRLQLNELDKFIVSMISSLSESHHFLGVVESKLVDIRVHTECRGFGRNDEEKRLYSFALSAIYSCMSFEKRCYKYDNVLAFSGIQFASAISMIYSHNLNLSELHLHLAKFTNVEALNLSGNQIGTVVGIGLESLKKLRCLDLHQNCIKDAFDTIGKIFDHLRGLEILAVRENPFMEIDLSQENVTRRSTTLLESKKDKNKRSRTIHMSRLALLRSIPHTKDYNCPLRFIDVELTVNDRMAAWDFDPEMETNRSSMAIFLATPRGQAREGIETLCLDAMGLKSVELSPFQALRHLRLRGNFMTTNSFKSVGWENLIRLEVLDLRENDLSMDFESLGQVVSHLRCCRNLIYLGLWCPPQQELIQKRNRRVSSVGLTKHFQRSSSIDVRSRVAEATDITHSRKLHVMKKAQKEYKIYRSALISLLLRLRNPKCSLVYLDESEILVEEILKSWVGTDTPDEKESFKYRVVERRTLGEKDLLQISSLNISGHDLCCIEIAKFKNLVQLSVAKNKLNSFHFKNSGIVYLSQLEKLDASSNSIENIVEFSTVLDKLPQLTNLNMLPNPCFKGKSKKENIYKLLGALKKTAWMDFKLRTVENIDVTFEDRYESLRQYKRHFEVSQSRLAFALVETRFKGDEMKVSLSGWGLDYVGILGLKCAANPNPTSLDTPLTWTKALIKECDMFEFIQNGSCKFIAHLDLSENCLFQLDKMHLERLPRLATLDLRNNQFDDWEIPCRGLRNCHSLRSIFLKCRKGTFSKPHEYAPLVFKELRGLDFVDSLSRSPELAVTPRQRDAIRFLRVIANVGLNGVASCNMSNQGLLSEHFPYVLSALFEVRSLCKNIFLNQNPWDSKGVGPGRDHYRRFVVTRLGGRLKTLDGSLIGDDERGNAAEWVENQLKIYGDAAEPLRKTWSDISASGLSMAKEFAHLRNQNVMRENLHYLPDLIVENENSKKKNERSTTKEMDIERSTRNDEEASDDEQTSNEGYNRDDNQSSKRPTPEIEGNVLQSTGALITKFEVFVSFLQVYGIIFNFDLSISWPFQWDWFNKFFMLLPTLFIVDLTFLLDAFDLDIPDDYLVYIKFFGTILAFFLISLTYAIFKGWSRRSFLKYGIRDWKSTRRKYNFVYILLILTSFVAVNLVELEASFLPTITYLSTFGAEGSGPSTRVWAWFILCASVLTICYGLLRLSLFYMRRQYLKDSTVEKRQFMIIFSKTKRGLQRMALFGLTVWYVPCVRTMLETYGFEFDESQLARRHCFGGEAGTGDERVMFGERCCLKTFQNETCVPFNSTVAAPLQIISMPFLIIVALGLPYVFYKLIKEGMEELNNGGYLIKKDSIQRSINIKKEAAKNILSLRKVRGKKKKMPEELLQYQEMGLDDINREIKRLKAEIKELTERQNDLYTQEVQANPKAQTYLYSPYSYKMRYYKLVSMAQKIILVATLLFIPPSLIKGAKMWVGVVVVLFQFIVAGAYHPFSDGMETLMELFSGGTNVVNCIVGLSITYGYENQILQDTVLFLFNFINFGVIIFTLLVSPIRRHLLLSSFHSIEKKLQVKKLREFAQQQAIAAQKVVTQSLEDVKANAAFQVLPKKNMGGLSIVSEGLGVTNNRDILDISDGVMGNFVGSNVSQPTFKFPSPNGMLSQPMLDQDVGLASQINDAKNAFSKQLGAYEEFIGDVELSKIAIDAAAFVPDDINCGFWSEPEEVDSAGDNYGGSQLGSFISSSVSDAESNDENIFYGGDEAYDVLDIGVDDDNSEDGPMNDRFNMLPENAINNMFGPE